MAGGDVETGRRFRGNAEGDQGGEVPGDEIFFAGNQFPGGTLLKTYIPLALQDGSHGVHHMVAGGRILDK